MNRASPKDLRNALEVANSMVKAGILFVPMPVLDQADFAALGRQSAERLEQMAQAIEQEAP
jgi:hypothetical protein